MPIFEYQCLDCSENFVTLVKNNEKVICKECESSNIKKLFSTFAVNSQKGTPSCAESCGAGFESGACGSGFCGSR